MEGVQCHSERFEISAVKKSWLKGNNVMIKFEEEITNLKKLLLEMASFVEEMIAKSTKALKERNMIIAQEVIKSDDKIN